MAEKELLDSRAPFRQTTFKQRLRETEWSKRWGWNLYTTAMGSGAVMACIYSVPYEFHGQKPAATVWFIVDICLFILCTVMTTIRAIKHTAVFRHSFYDQTEAPWMPTFNLSIATLIIGIIDLGIPKCGPWLITTAEVLFYIYMFIGACTALILQNTYRLLPRPLHLISPAECLEAFPLMLCGTIGSLLAPQVNKLRPDGALTILLFAIICQGLGLFISILKLSAWMLHHIVLPRAPSKTLPAYMIAAGVPGFTALALVNGGNAALEIFPTNGFLSAQAQGGIGIDPRIAAEVFAIVGHWFGLLMCGLFLWVVLIYVGWGFFNMVSMARNGYLGQYNLAWWAWTFPLTGMISCWGQWAKYFPSKAFGVLNIIGTLFVLCIWIFNIIGTGVLLYNGILPGVPEEFVPTHNDEDGELATDDLEPIRRRRRRGAEDQES
ncbi:hypothetical protein I316_06160 [Kwoniella heveanensis BCC8398]|uniref:Uncharacterized protein n=1 Tax=Kwoniella heveanensis BCC8398 TaxID=1296120 RepID=A0A1B9GN07_9TREE|nr:hypothetical protein I316_06160 [Kwoniella heveanensis BCC8398]